MGRITSPAAHALRQHWSHALLVAAVGAIALTVLLPIGALSRPDQPTGTALALEEVPAAGTNVVWTDGAAPPARLREGALGDAFLLLSVAGWITLGMAVVVILGRSAAATAVRAPDFGIRRAVGASRRNVVAALLLEAAAVLAVMLIGATVGAWLLARRAVTAWPTGVTDLRFAPWLPLLLTAGIVVLAWLAAMRFARRHHLTRPADPHVSLWVPALELALAVAVLTGGWLVLDRGRTLTAAAATSGTRGGLVLALDTGELSVTERVRLYDDLLRRLEGDSSVGVASLGAPGGVLGLGTVDDIMTDCGNCMGEANVWLPLHTLDAVHHFASPDTFAAGQVPIVRGRGLTSADRIGARPVVVVNRHLAGRHFEGGNAVGRSLWLRTGLWRRPYTVVGVADDDRPPVLGGATPPREALYLATLQHPPARAELLVRPRAGSALSGDAVGRAVAAALGRDGAVRSIAREDDLRAIEGRMIRWFGVGFAVAGLATLLIALIGVYGTTSLWVRSQAFELALRRAVGGTRFRVAAVLFARATVMAGGGVVLGAVLFAIVVRGSLTLVIPGLPLGAPGLFRPLALLLGGVVLTAATAALLPLLRERPAVRLQ